MTKIRIIFLTVLNLESVGETSFELSITLSITLVAVTDSFCSSK